MIRTRNRSSYCGAVGYRDWSLFCGQRSIGHLEAQRGESELTPGMGKNTMVVYTEQGDKIKVTVEGVDKDGKPTHGV